MGQPKKTKEWGKTFYFYGKIIAFAVGFAFMIEYFGAKGFWGVILLLFILSGYRAFKMRNEILIGIKQVEMAIWGKPLDKQFWKEGEWHKRKKRKLKFVWKKKNGMTK